MTNEEAIRILENAPWLIWGQATVISKEVERVREAEQMAIDALKSNDIIACGDCKHYIPHDNRCGYWNHGVKPLMWCSQAEGRTDEH